MNCWASSLGNCGGGQSGEHIFSSCLFGNEVTVQGLDWCLKIPKTIGVNGLKTNCLCRHHNSELSTLDENAKRLLVSIEMAMQAFENRKYVSKQNPFLKTLNINVNGDLFERWCFKTCVNILNSGSYDGNCEWSPTPELVSFIFGRTKLPLTAGLGVFMSVGEEILWLSKSSFSVVKDLGNQHQPAGFLLGFKGLMFAGSWEYDVEGMSLPGSKEHSQRKRPVRHIRQFSWAREKINLNFDWS